MWSRQYSEVENIKLAKRTRNGEKILKRSDQERTEEQGQLSKKEDRPVLIQCSWNHSQQLRMTCSLGRNLVVLRQKDKKI